MRIQFPSSRAILALGFLVCFSSAQVAWAQQTVAAKTAAVAPAAAAEPQAGGQPLAAPQVVPALPVPRLVKFSGVVKDAAGAPRTGSVGLTFSIYAEQEGGATLWMETQNVELDVEGRYSVLLGSTQSEGVPLDLFASGDPRWLGVRVELPGEVEQARVLLVSVPYALKASDADTLGGKPASAYALAPTEASAAATTSTSATASTGTGTGTKGKKPASAGTETMGYIPMFIDTTGNLGNSLIEQSGSAIGIGEAPVQTLDVNGGIRASTGLATGIRNTSPDAINTNALFLNGSNAMGVIGTSNAAFAPGALFTRASFFASGVERITVDGVTGNVGISNTAPLFSLDVGGGATNTGTLFLNGSNAVSLVAPNNIAFSGGAYFMRESFFTSPDGVMPGVERMTIDNNGNVGIGVPPPNTSGASLAVAGSGSLGGGLSVGGGLTVAGSAAVGGGLSTGAVASNSTGGLSVNSTAVATPTENFNSLPLSICAGTFDYALAVPRPSETCFYWLAEPVSPVATVSSDATLNLLVGFQAQGSEETGFHFSTGGLITFAPGQVFPGTVSSVSAGNGSITIGGTPLAPTVAVSSGGIGSGQIASGTVVRTLNGLTDTVNLAGANGLSVGVASGTLTVMSNATPASMAGTIVSRDASGSFSASTVTLSGDVALPNSSADGSAGIITLGGALFLHNFGSNNTFVGSAAGNLSTTGMNSAAFGTSALTANTTGGDNNAFGASALSSNMTGASNNAFGFDALQSNTGDSFGNGSNNAAFGDSALKANTIGNDNAALGSAALNQNSTGSNNTAVGFAAGFTSTPGNANTSGSSNTFIGSYSGPGTPTQLTNATAIGANAKVNCSNCVVLGDSTMPMHVGVGTDSPAQPLSVAGIVQSTTGGFMFPDGTTQTTAAAGGGSITAVNTPAGGGLMGGGSSGALNLSLVNFCASGQVLEWNGAAWTCATLGSGSGLTGVTAGTDLTGGGTSGTVTLNLDTTKVPQLNTANTFTGNQTVNGSLGVTGGATIDGAVSFLAPTSPQLIVNSGGSGTTSTGEISGNSSTTSGSGGLFLAASNAWNVGNNTGLLYVGPTSGQWEQGPSSTGGPTNFMSIALNSSATAAGNISFNTPVGVPVQTGRYGGPFTNTLDDGNNNMTVLGWIWQKGRNYLQSNPPNPASTSNTSFTMMGLGSTLTITPEFSGTVVIKIDSEAKDTVDGNGIVFEIFYGTGTPPSNGASTSGTQVGPIFERDFWGPNATVGFGTNLKITGLSVGQTYWFDIAIRSLGTGSSNATIQNIEFYIEEI